MTTFTLSADQELLQRSARDFVRERSPVSALRRLRDGGQADGFDRRLWHDMAELGFIGLAWPEAVGGAGLGQRELGLVQEELGRTLAATPMLASVLLAGEALLRAGSDRQRALLGEVAGGKALLALAYNEAPHHAPERCTTRAEQAGGGFVLTGQKRFVLDAHVASRLLVVARTAGAPHERRGLSLFEVDAEASGVRIERVGMIDSRNAGHVALEGVRVSREALVGELDDAHALLDAVFDCAAVGLAAEMLGSARAAFELTLDYLKTRKQFGVPIGTFQALKHRAADLYAELELSRSVVIDALSALDEHRGDLARAASIAKARVSDVFVRVAADAIQMHGGIGVTDEHDIGLYYKRARVTELLFGDGDYHRARFATLTGY